MVTQHFQGGVWQLSLLESISGIGTVLGGVTLGVWGGFKNRIHTVQLGIIGIGLGVFIFGLAPANLFWLGVVGFAITGFMGPITNGPLNALMQSKVEPEMQGRVMGLTNSLCAMMMPIALLIAAPVAELVGLRVWYWAGGALVMVIGFGSFFIPEIISLESSKPSVQAAATASE
jgi:DHA3 family macrolide efflux protein-like MFS transporter